LQAGDRIMVNPNQARLRLFLFSATLFLLALVFLYAGLSAGSTFVAIERTPTAVGSSYSNEVATTALVLQLQAFKYFALP
jgi:hypothetical protein